MNTVRDNIQQLGNEMSKLLTELLSQHSAIYRWNTPDEDSPFVWAGSDYAWKPLTVDGRKVQSQLLREFEVFTALVNALLHNQAEDTIHRYNEYVPEIKKLIEQNERPWEKHPSEALPKGAEAIQGIVTLIDRLYSGKADTLFVPDSNALISSPLLEKWTFPDIPTFTIVFTPAVLQELDGLKINHRNKEVRDKAEQVIRQIKEYRRRGNLSTGVPILSNKITAKAIATEPNFTNSLPWLDPGNKDDRIIASAIEVMRANTTSPVAIVSGDINVQNKADFARIPCCEPPNT